VLTIEQIREVVRQELGKGEVSVEFAELVKVETGDSGEPEDFDCAHERPMFCQATDDFTKLFEPAVQELKKHAGVANAGWDEQVSVPLSKAEKRHADGIEIEKHGKQTWHWHWQGGELVKSMVEDPDLPGGVMHFDRDGNEIETAA
jgi:hypothetical protein